MGDREINDTDLIECANRSNKNDRIGIIKVRNPRLSLAPRTANIKQVPCNSFSMDVDVKYVFCNAHSLDAGMKDVVCLEKVEYMRAENHKYDTCQR